MTHLPNMQYNVTLTEAEVALIKAEIVQKRNKSAACQYAGIRQTRFDGILNGALLKKGERDSLIQFCKIVNPDAAVATATTNPTTHA